MEVKEIIGKAIKTKQGITEKESEIAKEFNKYSASVGTALKSKILIITKHVSGYKELSFQEFEKVLQTMKPNKAIGCHSTVKLLLSTIQSISSKCLIHLLKKHSFLKNLKSQKLFHFFKKGENYRSMSILSVIQKFLNILCTIVCIFHE